MSTHRPAPDGRPPRVLLACLLAGLLLGLAACSGAEGSATPQGRAAPTRDVAAEPLRYVALGDSYVSAPLVPVTDVADGCFRSSANYPARVSEKIDVELEDRSCGGARTQDFRRSQYPGVPSQLSALGPEVDVVTIGIGGNDENVYRKLTRTCPSLRARDPQGAPCREFMGAGGQDLLLDALDRTAKKVTRLVRDVQSRAIGAQVLVVGYPQIISAENTCPELPLARGDYAYAERVNRALADALRTAARATGATYVDVWAASQGHDICSDDPWINGAVRGQPAAEYHPFAQEQEAVADLVVQAIRDSG